MHIGPCLACDGCYKTGRCIVKDDFQAQYEAVLESDALVLATPVYFGAVTAQVKPFIDRFQCFWARRDIVKDPLPPGPAGGTRKGVLITVGGIDKPIMFEGVRTTFDFVMRSLEGEVWAELTYGGYDEQEAILENSEALARARELGRRLALGLNAE
jgi:multimeric flavodoxin WrbA